MVLLWSACLSGPALPPFGPVPLVAPAAPCRPAESPVLAACVVDGDTVDVRSCGAGSERIRILGVDAPEVEHPGRPTDCYAAEARDLLAGWIGGSDVALSFDGSCVDAYGRTLAYLWLVGDTALDRAGDVEVAPWLGSGWEGNEDEPAILVNELLLGVGAAIPYPEVFAGPLLLQDRLDRAASDALRNGRGLWGACDPVAALVYRSAGGSSGW